MKLLVENGADLEPKSTSSSATPCSVALYYGHTEVHNYLKEKMEEKGIEVRGKEKKKKMRGASGTRRKILGQRQKQNLCIL